MIVFGDRRRASSSVRLEPSAEVHDRLGAGLRVVRREGALVGEQMVELPDRQAAGAQQGAYVEVDAGVRDEPLAVGEPGADRPADAQSVPLVREEARDAGVVGDHRHPCGGR